MTRAALLALAERAEKAKAADQGAVLLSVVYALDLPTAQRAAIERMIEVGAFESAAVALVPEGWRFAVENLNRAGPLAVCEPERGPYTRAEAATPALALTAAALRALAEEASDE